MSAKKRYPTGYGEISSYADYCPWDSDPRFATLYNRVRPNTMVDKMRCYELCQLVEQTSPVQGDILEVGVWRGGTGALLCAYSNLVPELQRARVYMADTFAGVVKAGERDPYYRGGEHADSSAAQVRALLHDMGLNNYTLLEGVFPEETAQHIGESAIRFCHIDVDVYQSAKDIIDWVWPRVPRGGIVVFDDYGFYGCEGVTSLVNELRYLPDRVFVHNINGHGILVRSGD